MTCEDLLLEIGTEELPASFVRVALEAMPGIAAELLAAARLTHGEVTPLGTPRRLALIVRDVALSQPDLEEVVQGPPARVAMDEGGALTRAGEGFAKKAGVDPAALFVVETDKGAYVSFRRREAGKPAHEVLGPLLGELIGRIRFPKVMRWGAGEHAFGRPIHWLLALHGERALGVSFADISGGRETRGHRFLSPAAFEVPHVGAYVDLLREAHVVASVQERVRLVSEALHSAATRLDGVLVADDFLLQECASLVEEPHVVAGSFDAAFLDLPEGVIVSVMRDHQRYFAVRARGGGGLLPRYLNVVNTALDPETIARGNDRVLRARLADARFFVDEDRKRPLTTRTADLDGVVFQKKLGSLGDKVRRVRSLTHHFFGEGEDARLAERAATLCKNDLVTLIVGEFPELQGEMGRFYALEQGEEPVVADALRDHYLPRGAGDAVPAHAVSAAVAIADRADTLAGCFGIGLVPTGSADPFALRRAALGVCRIALDGAVDVSVREIVAGAWDAYPSGVLGPREEIVAKLDEFFRARLKALYGDRYPTDLVEACLCAWDGGSIRDLDRRIVAVSALRALPEYESLAIAFKRAYNIAKDGPEGEVDPALLRDDAERALAEAFFAMRRDVEGRIEGGDYEAALAILARDLRAPIDRFFEEVFVMVEDEALRRNRLRLLRAISDTLTGIAHFHQLSTQVPQA